MGQQYVEHDGSKQFIGFMTWILSSQIVDNGTKIKGFNNMGVEPKIEGKHPNMDVLFHGTPY